MSLLYLAHLNKPERIEILVMVRYGDRQRTHVHVHYSIKNILKNSQ
jgi:hypothetical protein